MMELLAAAIVRDDVIVVVSEKARAFDQISIFYLHIAIMRQNAFDWICIHHQNTS
jgi:hypothetical protein